jgi:phytoene desaturase
MTPEITAKSKVAVIGAGLGGLACAVRLAHAGFEVTLFEKNERAGGKLNLLEVDGFSWDTGPSLLTMPQVLEALFKSVGRRLDDYLSMVRLENTCRYRWLDGTVIDENANFWRQPETALFLDYARGLYEISEDVFLNNALEDWWRQFSPANLPKLRHFPKIASPRTLHEKVQGHFSDPHLVQLFDRFATYNGSSPYRTPAAFNIIPFVQAEFGGWYVRGGMYRIGEALVRLAEEFGVRLVVSAEVSSIAPATRGHQIRVGGEQRVFDIVVCNSDALTARERLLDPPLANEVRPLSTSGFVLFLGVTKKYPQLEHHNIFFSDDYPREFAQLFDRLEPASEPTIYVAVNSKTDPGRAPEGCDNWFVLVNAPPAQSKSDWSDTAEDYGSKIIARLERFGFENLRAHVRCRRHFTPADFETRYLAHAGSIYGFASHGMMAAFRRPAMQPRGLRDFYFVGGSTHPGGGIPLVILSGQIAARKIIKSHAHANRA